MFDIPRVKTSLRIDHYSLILCLRVLQRVKKFSQRSKDVLLACLWYLKHLFVDFSVSPILSDFRFLPRTTVRLAVIRRKWPWSLSVEGEIGSKVQVAVIGESLGSQQGYQKHCRCGHHAVCLCIGLKNKRSVIHEIIKKEHCIQNF